MPVIDFSVIFDQRDQAYVPGQVVTGRVRIHLGNPKVITRLKIKFEGRAYVEWSDSESDGDSRKSVTRCSIENHFKKKLVLDEREGNFTLSTGEHFYPFSVLLPKNIPSSFTDAYGNISYYAIAKLQIPGQLNKVKKEYFKVKNNLNLNDFPSLKTASEVQKGKKFYHLCCIPCGRLTTRAYIPRSGFVATENIPLILEINNESSVDLNKITAYLVRKIEWRADGEKNYSTKKLSSFSLGSAKRYASLTMAENIPIPVDEYPYLENCRIIMLKHYLQIEVDAAGPHCDLDVAVPVTIGNVPYIEEGTCRQDDRFLMPPDYDELGESNAGFVCYEVSDKEVILSASSLATESKSGEIFQPC